MPINFSKELNAEQLKVVEAGNGPCLVLAGAGTGKTRTIVYRVAYLLEQGVAPENILLLTFTNKAAREMLKRVEELVGQRSHGLHGGTFHHMGSTILRKYGKNIGVAPNFTIVDENDKKDLLRIIYSEHGIGKQDEQLFPKPDVVGDMISFAVNSGRTLEEIIQDWLPKHLKNLDTISNIATRYEQRKRERNVLDFDDLLSLWLRLLRECPETRAHLRDQFAHILVDEYQDTNYLQGMIIEAVADAQKNILVVGDDAQAIYAFRAATVENIMRFPEVFTGAQVFRLEQNYRSTQPILDLANSCISFNRRQFEKKLRGQTLRGSRPRLVACASTLIEARFIVDKIVEFRAQGESLLQSAVLFRAAYHAIHLELELQKRRIPYVVRGGIRFFEQAHIKDIIAYLKIVANPDDEIAHQRILRLEPGIGERTAMLLTAEKGKSPERVSEKTRISIERVNSRIEKIKQLGRAYEMIAYLLENFYEAYAEEAFENAPERLEDLDQLVLFAKEYATLDDFLADAMLTEGFRGERTTEDGGKSKESLVLSTIHQAKGLEWKNVFIIGLVEGQFPHFRSYKNRTEIEEERRLFYVAATRARERLFLTYSFADPGAYDQSLRQLSLFVRELPREVYDEQGIEDDYERIIEID